MARKYVRDSAGKFSSVGGGQAASKAKTPNYAGLDYKGKEGKSFVVSDGTRTKYLNNKEFGEFSRQKLNFKSNAKPKPAKGKSDEKTIIVKIPKSKKTPEQEAAQLKRDRQSVRMGAQTIGKIYPKDGSRGGGRAENKKIRDKEAASVRANRKIMAHKAKKLAKAKP